MRLERKREVRAEGIEPSSSLEHGHLKPACLPSFTTPAACRSYRLGPSGICRRRHLLWGTSPNERGVDVRSAEQFDAAKRLTAAGVNDCAIARQIGVPRTTVRDWRRRPQVRPRLVSESPCGVIHDFSELPAAAYSYVLGLYLGDGCISRSQRVWRLRITLDAKYPAIINRCRAAIDMLMPRQHAGIVQRKGCVEVWLCSKHWPCLFPQHGPGKKHLRPIQARALATSTHRHGDRGIHPGPDP